MFFFSGCFGLVFCCRLSLGISFYLSYFTVFFIVKCFVFLLDFLYPQICINVWVVFLGTIYIYIYSIILYIWSVWDKEKDISHLNKQICPSVSRILSAPSPRGKERLFFLRTCVQWRMSRPMHFKVPFLECVLRTILFR